MKRNKKKTHRPRRSKIQSFHHRLIRVNTNKNKNKEEGKKIILFFTGQINQAKNKIIYNNINFKGENLPSFFLFV